MVGKWQQVIHNALKAATTEDNVTKVYDLELVKKATLVTTKHFGQLYFLRKNLSSDLLSSLKCKQMIKSNTNTCI